MSFEGQQSQGVEDHEANCVCVCDLNDSFHVRTEIDHADRAENSAGRKRPGLINHERLPGTPGGNGHGDILRPARMSRISHEQLVSTGLWHLESKGRGRFAVPLSLGVLLSAKDVTVFDVRFEIR